MTKPSYTEEREKMFSEQITIKVTPMMKNWLMNEAKENNCKLSTVCRSLLIMGMSYFGYQ